MGEERLAGLPLMSVHYRESRQLDPAVVVQLCPEAAQGTLLPVNPF